MKAPETLVVLNPTAGGGRAERIWRRLEPAARQRLGAFVVERTRQPGEAQAIARALAPAAGLVVVVGGDGTIHEVVNGVLAGRETAHLAVIPAGAGNDFARNAGLPLDAYAAFERLGRLEPHPFDVGHCSLQTGSATRLFVNSLSLGVSARANRLAFRIRRALPGQLRYLVSGVFALLAEGPASYRVSTPGRLLHHGPALNLTLANGAHFGAGLLISPASLPDDGVFELVLIGPLGRLRALGALSRLRRGGHLALEGVRVLQLRDPVTITQEQGPMQVEADGENFSANGALAIRILAGRLILCN